MGAVQTAGVSAGRSCTGASAAKREVRVVARGRSSSVSSLPIMEKGEQFLRVIGIFALLCSHYKISL
jgi:hypothetical protein